MKKVLMTASAVSHFMNFHLPYIRYMAENGAKIYTAAAGTLDIPQVFSHTDLPFRKKLFHPANIWIILKLSKLMRKEKFDIIYTNSTLAGFCGRMALKLSGCRNTLCVHICHGYLFNDGEGLRSKIYLAFEKAVRRRTDVLAVMNADDLKIAEKYSLGKKIVFLNGMGLDQKLLPECSDELIRKTRSQLGVGQDCTLFLCAAEFSPRKNQKLIIKACSLMKRKNFVLAFAGEGETVKECKSFAKEQGVSDKILFLGQRNDMNLLYRSCDCLISASRYEGLPFNVMEALYCGAQVILSDVKGNRDLAPEGSLYPFDDAKALAALMDKAGSGRPRENFLDSRYLLENTLKENAVLLKMDITA